MASKCNDMHRNEEFEIFQDARPLILTIGHLKRFGLLNSKPQELIVDIGARIHVRRRDKQQLIVHVPRTPYGASYTFPIQDGRFWTSHLIQYVFRELKFGGRPYFLCPLMPASTHTGHLRPEADWKCLFEIQ